MRKDSNFYLPQVINIHGGAFSGREANFLNIQSDKNSRQFNSHIIYITYKLSKLLEKRLVNIEYQTEEIVDTIKYFYENCKKYKIEINNNFVLVNSAGDFLQ